MCIYIYIYRERERQIYLCTYTYTYTYEKRPFMWCTTQCAHDMICDTMLQRYERMPRIQACCYCCYSGGSFIGEQSIAAFSSFKLFFAGRAAAKIDKACTWATAARVPPAPLNRRIQESQTTLYHILYTTYYRLYVIYYALCSVWYIVCSVNRWNRIAGLALATRSVASSAFISSSSFSSSCGAHAR